MFGKPRKSEAFNGRLAGVWRAETLSGDVHGSITAIFRDDGTFLTRNQLDVRGLRSDPITQTGRYRVEPLDRSRFRLFTIDENGAPLSSSLRTFVDDNTMLNEVGRITFKRVANDGLEIDGVAAAGATDAPGAGLSAAGEGG